MTVKATVWVVALHLLGIVGFGALVRDATERHWERRMLGLPPRGPVLGRVVFRIAGMPKAAFRGIGDAGDQWFGTAGRLTSSLEFSSSPFRRTNEKRDYAVVSLIAPNEAGLRVELVDLSDGKTVHAWKTGTRRVRYADVLSDGSLIGGTDGESSTTFRMDACSNVVWQKHLGAHRSMERDADGNYWMPWSVAPKTVSDGSAHWLEHGLTRISPEGRVLSQIALSGALKRAGRLSVFYSSGRRYERGPFHINDVEPVLQDGPFWRQGDLFVSFRTRAVVLLYRPSTDEVLWLRSGPWLGQHDIDVLSESEISVYSNNTITDEDNLYRVLGANEVYVYDFATGEVRSPWREAMRRHDVRTETRGGATLFRDGSVMLEESGRGRLLMLSADGERVWSYTNRVSDGSVRMLQASRYLDAEYGAVVTRAVAARDCGAAAG